MASRTEHNAETTMVRITAKIKGVMNDLAESPCGYRYGKTGEMSQQLFEAENANGSDHKIFIWPIA